MAIPSKVVGGGNNSTAQNVLKVTFSEATSDVPILSAWDDYTFATVLNSIFVGTSGNGSRPMLCAVATTDAAPVSAWKPTDPVAGGATINRLKGSTSYVNLSAAAIAAGGSVRFNLNWEIPSDCPIGINPSTSKSYMYCVIKIDFNYPGTAPVLTWAFNDNEAGGTEAVPVWTTLTSGPSANKVRAADAGSTIASHVLHRPPSGVQDAGEVWAV